MTLNKKIIALFLTLSVLFLIVGCQGAEHLDIPVAYTEKGIIRWDKITNADKYEVKINDNINLTYQTFYELPITYDNQTFNVSIKAVSENSKYINSDFSTAISYDCQKLATVKNVSNTANNVSWSTVTNADFFVIELNNKLITSTDTKITIPIDQFVSIS